MTAIAAKVYADKIEIAGDSQVSNTWGSKRLDKNFEKLFIVNELIIGGTGTAQEISLMHHYAETHKPLTATEKDVLDFVIEFSKWKSDIEGDSEINNVYLIVYDKKVFEVEGLLITEVKNYSAIGSGMDFANAAMYLGHSAKEAIEVAKAMDCYVGGDVVEYKVKL